MCLRVAEVVVMGSNEVVVRDEDEERRRKRGEGGRWEQGLKYWRRGRQSHALNATPTDRVSKRPSHLRSSLHQPRKAGKRFTSFVQDSLTYMRSNPRDSP